jgi:hypothetical protein
MTTGYKLPDGKDFSKVFVAGNAGIVTGYKTSEGKDLGSIFKKGNSGISTGFKNGSGADLGSLLGNTYDKVSYKRDIDDLGVYYGNSACVNVGKYLIVAGGGCYW